LRASIEAQLPILREWLGCDHNFAVDMASGLLCHGVADLLDREGRGDGRRSHRSSRPIAINVGPAGIAVAAAIASIPAISLGLA
jgi:hypothetical protein